MGAREKILHLINNYAFTIDTGDLDGFARLFENGEWTVEGAPPNVGAEQVRAAISTVRLYPDGTPRTKHVTSNVDLAIDEHAGTAAGQCYVTLFQQTDELPLQAIFAGHYFDEFERAGGKWRFKKRLIRHALVGNLSAHLGSPASVVPGS